MNTDSFTDEQMLNLVNNTIITKTEFTPLDFTGGSVILTTTHNNTNKKFKVSLYFGYKGKHSVNRQVTISKDLYYIWAKAILVKAYSMDAVNTGMDLNELNSLMKSTSNSNSNISNSSNSMKSGDNPGTTPVPIAISETKIIANRVSMHLLSKIQGIKPNFVCDNISSWDKDIDRAIRLDKRTEDQLIGCIDYIYTGKGDFWIPNIMSGKKLREKFDTIEMQKIDPKGNDDWYETLEEEMQNEQNRAY